MCIQVAVKSLEAELGDVKDENAQLWNMAQTFAACLPDRI